MTENNEQLKPKEQAEKQSFQVAATESLHDSKAKDDSSSENPTHKHKKKRRKHKKIKQRDPEQIKEIRMERLNQKREGHWNSRFVNESIPDIFASKPKKKKLQIFRKQKSPIQSAYIQRDGNRNKLPNLTSKQNTKDKQAKTTQKAFKIRKFVKKQTGIGENTKHIVKSQQKQSTINADQRQTITLKIETINEEQKNHKKPLSRKQKTKEKLLIKLQQTTVITPINQTYKKMLINLIEISNQKKHKQLRITLEDEINTIGSQKNVYVIIQRLIKQRLSLIRQIKQLGSNSTLKLHNDLQFISLALIEQILKFKAKWEELYFNLFDISKKIDYQYEGKNYLLKMKDQMKELELDGISDPFLVAKTSQLQSHFLTSQKQNEISQRKQLMLKIRACELLLIEEQLTHVK